MAIVNPKDLGVGSFPNNAKGWLSAVFQNLRERMELTSDQTYPKWYSLHLNPNAVTIQPKEKLSSYTRTGGGYIYNWWLDEKLKADDLTEIRFQGSSGNLQLRTLGGTVAANMFNVDSRLFGLKMDAWAALQRLHQLTREPMFLREAVSVEGGTASADSTESLDGEQTARVEQEEGIEGRGSEISESTLRQEQTTVVRPNRQRIFYKSPAFPDGILFYGWYRTPLEIVENAQNPRTVTYSFTFVVEYSEPPLDELFSAATLWNVALGNLASAGVISETTKMGAMGVLGGLK